MRLPAGITPHIIPHLARPGGVLTGFVPHWHSSGTRLHNQQQVMHFISMIQSGSKPLGDISFTKRLNTTTFIPHLLKRATFQWSQKSPHQPLRENVPFLHFNFILLIYSFNNWLCEVN